MGAASGRAARGMIPGLVFVLTLAGCGSTSASRAGRCARIWNAGAPTNLSVRFTEAIVYPWTDKAEDDGCGVVFVSAPGREWVLFAGVVKNDRIADWSRDEGDRWGEDSPEGGPTEANAVVLPGGLLSVPA